jgi:hypothetical protein
VNDLDVSQEFESEFADSTGRRVEAIMETDVVLDLATLAALKKPSETYVDNNVVSII